MIDRLRRLVGRGTMRTELVERIAAAEAEVASVNRRTARVEARMDEIEEILQVRREAATRRAHGPTT